MRSVWGSCWLPRLICGGCISLALTRVERGDPRDRDGALVTRLNYASAVEHAVDWPDAAVSMFRSLGPHRTWFADLPSALYRALGFNLRAEHRA